MTELVVETAGKIVTVTINRPPVNALTLALYGQIADTFEAIGARTDVHCAIFTGAGTRAFCAGLDLKEFLAATPEQDPERAKIVRRTFSAVRNCAIPVIAAVNGPALGAGCVLASVCDIRIAAANATFGLPEINVGRCGGGAHVGRYVPQGMLRKMFFTGRPISAEEAYRVNLIEEIVPGGAADGRGAGACRHHLRKGAAWAALRKARRLTKSSSCRSRRATRGSRSYSTKLMHTEDAREATRAVLEKRAPAFQGK